MLAKGAPPYSPSLARPRLQSNGKSFFFFFNRTTTKRLSCLTIGAALQPPTADASLDHQPDEASSSSSSTGSRRLARNFDKLKTQKLISIAKRASLAKQSLMDPVEEAAAEKKFLKKKNIARADHEVNRRDTSQREVFSSRARGSAPSSSAPRSRGWGDGGSVDRYRPASRSADRSEFGSRGRGDGGSVDRYRPASRSADRSEFGSRGRGYGGSVDRYRPASRSADRSEFGSRGRGDGGSVDRYRPASRSADRSEFGSRGRDDGGSVDRYRPASRSADRSESRHNFSADSDFFSRKSFRDMGCSELMISSLKEQCFLRPSHIQAMAFTHVIERKTCVIADQSGSGKTLSYLIPVIQRLKQDELQGLGETKANSPRVLIIVPTAELGSQVLNICRSMSKSGLPFRSMIVTGGHRQKTQLENLENGVDVLIATPGRFLFLIKEGFLQLTNLECAVLDEVDILFNDEDFELAQQSLINASSINMQYLFVTATLPVDIYHKLVEVFPDCKVIMGPGIHRTSTGLEEFLVDCSGEEEAEKTPETAFANKKSALMQIVEQRPVPKTIVFCNKIETCRQLENLLKRFDRKEKRVRVIPFHAALEQKTRVGNMKEFMSPERKEGSLFLVCTDRASRGIDFNGVDHVVLFDFPRDPSEYVRRVGRTARGAGGKGKAFIFVVGKQVSLARRIIERNQKGHPLHEVPCAYELMG